MEDRRRAAVQDLADQYDANLRREFGEHLFSPGSCLLLGRHYGRSPVVYFSLNPGYARNSASANLGSTGCWNVPFFNDPELKRQYIYLHNCERFFASDPLLNRWVNSAVTSAFLVPWRTRNVGELLKLNQATQGRVFEFSRKLSRCIIQHHRAEVILAAGKAALQLMTSMRLLDGPLEQDEICGPGGIYQWSRCCALVDGRKVTILQIPHFSRANSPAMLRALVPWLRQELGPFGW